MKIVDINAYRLHDTQLVINSCLLLFYMKSNFEFIITIMLHMTEMQYIGVKVSTHQYQGEADF